MKNVLVCLPVLTLFSTGCALDAGSAPDHEGPDAEPPVSITAISRNTEGSTSVHEVTWSRAQLRAAMRERINLAAAQGVIIDPTKLGLPKDAPAAPRAGEEGVGEAVAAISADPACGGASLWITDNGSWNDLTHMICYTGTGFTSLPSSWVGTSEGGTHQPYGVWGGSLSGGLGYISPGCDAGCGSRWAPYQLESFVTDPIYLSFARQFGVFQELTPIHPTTTQSNDVLDYGPPGSWAAQNVVDDNPNTAYSSNWSPSSANVNGAWLAAWMGASTTVSQIVLGARRDPATGSPNAFPANYRVYVTTPDNTAWAQIAASQVQPQSQNGWNVTINLDTPIQTWGVWIVPDVLGVDTNGNHYFQMGEVSFR